MIVAEYLSKYDSFSQNDESLISLFSEENSFVITSNFRIVYIIYLEKLLSIKISSFIKRNSTLNIFEIFFSN